MRWFWLLLTLIPAPLFADWRVVEHQPAEAGNGIPFRLKVTDDTQTAELLLTIFRPADFSFRVISNASQRYSSVEDAI